MLRSEGPSDYRKALLATGAAVGVGLIAYRLWSRRRRSLPAGEKPKTSVEPSPTHRGFQQGKEKETHASPPSASIQKPSTEKVEHQITGAGKETITIHPDVTGTDILSTSGTFVKVSPSVSPVSFEEIGASYVEPMSLPSTPPLIVEPHAYASRLPHSVLPTDDISLSSSSMSFVAIPTESPQAQSSDAGTLESDAGRSVTMTENNDIVVIGTHSEQSSDYGNGSEDAEVAAVVGTDEPDQTTESGQTIEVSSQSADFAHNTSEA